MLTSAQKAILKPYIETNYSGMFSQEIADALNVKYVPDFNVWKSTVSINEIMSNGFDWTRVDNMTVGESRIWEYMTQLGFINPSQANIRAGINESFKGTVQDDTMRQNIYGNCITTASIVEKLLATGSGVLPDKNGVGPSTRGFFGPISYIDVEATQNS